MVCLIMYIKKYKTHKHTHVLERMSDTVYENLMHPYVCGFVVMEKEIYGRKSRGAIVAFEHSLIVCLFLRTDA